MAFARLVSVDLAQEEERGAESLGRGPSWLASVIAAVAVVATALALVFVGDVPGARPVAAQARAQAARPALAATRIAHRGPAAGPGRPCGAPATRRPGTPWRSPETRSRPASRPAIRTGTGPAVAGLPDGPGRRVIPPRREPPAAARGRRRAAARARPSSACARTPSPRR